MTDDELRSSTIDICTARCHAVSNEAVKMSASIGLGMLRVDMTNAMSVARHCGRHYTMCQRFPIIARCTSGFISVSGTRRSYSIRFPLPAYNQPPISHLQEIAKQASPERLILPCFRFLVPGGGLSVHGPGTALVAWSDGGSISPWSCKMFAFNTECLHVCGGSMCYPSAEGEDWCGLGTEVWERQVPKRASTRTAVYTQYSSVYLSKVRCTGTPCQMCHLCCPQERQPHVLQTLVHAPTYTVGPHTGYHDVSIVHSRDKLLSLIHI